MEKDDVLSLDLSRIKIVNIQKIHGSLEISIENNTLVGICPNCGVVSDKVNDTRYHLHLSVLGILVSLRFS